MTLNYKIISPLADGSDRLVAKLAKEHLDAELIVPIPFMLNEYKKDFDDDSKDEFDDILNCIEPIELSNFEDEEKEEPVYDKKRSDLYKSVGKYVVDNSDILMVIWDGKEAKGVGGTAHIYRYAESQNKVIIYINSNTLKVKYINK